jgi:hypothetical protein
VDDLPTDVLATRPPAVPPGGAPTVPGRSGGTASGTASSPLRADLLPGGTVPTDDERLERSLAFSRTHVSDDGQVTIRRAPAPPGYSGARFTGTCAICVRAGLLAPAGEALADVRAAVRFLAAHDHGEAD